MKQYTSKDQTAKLIELGFPKPKGWGNKDISNGMSIALYNDGREDFNYSIGELIEFLPKEITDEYDEVTSLEFSKTEVYYTNFRVMSYYANGVELIDALFNMCVTLKEEGVI